MSTEKNIQTGVALGSIPSIANRKVGAALNSGYKKDIQGVSFDLAKERKYIEYKTKRSPMIPNGPAKADIKIIIGEAMPTPTKLTPFIRYFFIFF